MAARALRIAGIVVAAGAVLAAAGSLFLSSRYFAVVVEGMLARSMLDAKQRTLKFDGLLEISFWPNAGFKVGKVSLSERGSAQEFASFDAARVAVAVMPLLARRVVLDVVAVDGLKAVIVRRRDGSLNIDDLLVGKKPSGAPLRLDIAAARLGGELIWRDEKSGAATTVHGIELAGSGVHADTGSKAFRVDDLILAGTADDIRARLDLTGVDGSAVAVAAKKLAVDIDAKAGATTVRGTLSSPLAADLAARTLTLDKLSGDIDFAHPRLPMKHIALPLRGALRADLASCEGNLGTHIDESTAALKFGVARYSPLALHFDLDIDRLDLDRYLPQGTGAAAEKRSAPGLSALKDVEIDGAVHVGRLRVAGIEASNLMLRVKAEKGKLDGGGPNGLKRK